VNKITFGYNVIENSSQGVDMKPFEFNRKTTSRFTLDSSFSPIALNHLAFLKCVSETKDFKTVKIALERSSKIVSTYETNVFGAAQNQEKANYRYLERLIKTLLWIKGGYKIYIAGYPEFAQYLKDVYSHEGKRSFDYHFMSKIYESPLLIIDTRFEDLPLNNETSVAIGRHLDGYRIGFDAGGSDRKVSALVEGVAIYSEEVVWHPKLESNPQYHKDGILDSIRRAASKLPKVDAIGISSAGIIIDNRIMASSLFIRVNEEDFNHHVKSMYIDIQKEFDVPIMVANDGDVTALAGSISLNQNQILGIAMGTSEAAGYVDQYGNLTGWLNELAFVPLDDSKEAMMDEWSFDIGCGVKYLSQDAVIKLAAIAGIELDASLSLAEKLKVVQKRVEDQDEKAQSIFEMIGCYLAYAILYYQFFYDIQTVLILGHVTSGLGGQLIIDAANEVFNQEKHHIRHRIKIQLPDEMSRRVGQSIAAASLAKIKKE